MGTIAQKLNYTLNSVTDAWNACIEKDALVPEEPRDIGQLGNSIRSIEQGTGEWFYNPQWIAEPEMPITQGASVVYKIFPSQLIVAFYVNIPASYRYTIDWGDGVIEASLPPSAINQHTYNFSTLVSPVDEDGNKTVVIKVYPTNVAQPINYIRFSQVNGVPYNNLVFAKVNCHSMTQTAQMFGSGSVTTVYRNASTLEAVYLKNIPPVSMAQFFNNCMRLRVIDTDGEPFVSNNLGSLFIGCTSLDGDFVVELLRTTNFTYSALGTVTSALDSLTYKCSTTDIEYGSPYILQGNLYCYTLDIREFMPQFTVAQFNFINENGFTLLNHIKLNWDSFKTTANQMISFSNARLFKFLDTTGTMGSNVTTISVAGTNAGIDFLATIIPDLLDRTGISPGTLNIQFTPAVTAITPTQIADIANKNWDLIL